MTVRILLSSIFSLLLVTAVADAIAPFTDIGAGLPGGAGGSAAWGDYDNDGDLDILLAGFTGSGYISRVYRNDGADTFTDIGAGLSGVAYSSAAWGDYDNDGDLDILLTGDTGSGRISRVYRNDGEDTFTDIGAGLPGVYYSSVAWGDYDNDGDLDILLTGDTGSGYISRVYRNDGADTFTDIVAGLPGVARSSVAWGDYDNDGDLDILLTGFTGSGSRISRVYENDSGAFTDSSAGLPGVWLSSVAWGDYDNDAGRGSDVQPVDGYLRGGGGRLLSDVGSLGWISPGGSVGEHQPQPHVDDWMGTVPDPGLLERTGG